MRTKLAVLCTALLGLWLGFACKEADSGVFPHLRVLFVVSSHDKLGDTGKSTGFWLPELTHPYFAMNSPGKDRVIDIDIASPKGGKAPVDPRSVDLKDPDNKRFMESADTKRAIENTIPLSKVKIADYKGVFFVGGHGPMWDLADNADVRKITRTMYENKHPVAAVCHGPAALVNVQLKGGKYLVDGKKVTSFTNAEEEGLGYTKVVPFLLETKLKERGAKFVAAAPQKENIVVDGLLVTGQNPASARALGEKFAELVIAQPL